MTAVAPAADATHRPVEHVRIAVVGAGFAGLGLAWNLVRAGIEDFTILERAQRVGGVWRDNTYPGAACDVPSHLYSLSFAPKPDWERTFSRGPQIQGYLEDVAREHDLERFISFGEELLDATWEEAEGHWRVTSTTRVLTADVLVSCAGPLTEPTYPDVPGLDTFGGLTFHSNRWDHAHSLAGKRVVVVGSGASAVQLVPELQREVASLVVLQRTPGWVVPRRDRQVTRPERFLLRRVPALLRLQRGMQFFLRDALLFRIFRRNRVFRLLAERGSRSMLEQSVEDPELRRALTPDFEIGCKRVLLSSDWYAALAAPNVTLVPHALAAIGPDAVTAADGSVHEADAIVFATGFETTTSPVFERIHGRDGRSLVERWAGAPRFHRATTVSGYPNLFLVCGPGTGLGHGSMIWQMEAQMVYVMDALAHLERHGLQSVDVRPEAEDGYMGWAGAGLERSVWVKGGCESWYMDSEGRPTFLWPDTMWKFRRMLGSFDAEHYAARPAARPTAVSPAPAG